MTIRTKLVLLALLPMVTVLVVALILVLMAEGRGAARERRDAAEEVVKGVFEINLLASEYVQQPSQRVREQFNQRDQSLQALFEQMQPSDPEQQRLVAGTRRRYQELASAIIRMSAYEPEETAADTAMARLRAEQLNRQVMTRSHALVSLASRQAAHSTAEVEAIHKWSVVWIVSLLSLMTMLVGGGAWLIARDIVHALLNLRSDFEIVGRGALNHHIPDQRGDEIGELAQAFNTMSQRLRSITVSRDELQREIEDRRQAEVKLQHAAAALTRSNQELEQFAYIASHDLQEPLRKVRGFGEMLRDHLGAALDGEADDYLRRMFMAAQRMGELIDGLLTYSRVTTKVMPFEPVDLNEVTRQTLEDLEFRIRESGGTVQAQPLPTVQADPLQMRQLMQNLIGNGLKFHHPDQPPLVEVFAQEDQDHWRIFVRDHGIGIDPKYHDRLFMPFRRLHGRGSIYAGTGIGLAICRKIAERHGGTITLESATDQGATFIVTLPRTPPQPQEGVTA